MNHEQILLVPSFHLVPPTSYAVVFVKVISYYLSVRHSLLHAAPQSPQSITTDPSHSIVSQVGKLTYVQKAIRSQIEVPFIILFL